MKNVFFILFVSVLALSIFSCQKDDSFDEIIENDIAHKDSISIASQLAYGREIEINVDSLFAEHGDLENRSGKTIIYNANLYGNHTMWSGMNITRAELQTYNFHMEVKNGTGIASPYVYGNVNGGSWRYVKGNSSGTTKVITMTISDLQAHETHGYIGAYYSSAGHAYLTIYREKKSGSTGGSTGTGNTSLSITPSTVSPSSGTVSTTNFSFAVQTNPKPVSTMTAQVEFKAPDNLTYTYSMDRLTQGFSHRRTLSQPGTYQYRYVVKYNGQTQSSSWMSLQVTGSGGSNGSGSSSLSITPSNVSPSSGNVSSTNFSFAVQTNPKPVSSMTAQVEFKAPNNLTYTYSMDRLTQGFSHRRTLSQPGTYQYRYVVKYNGQTKTSSWMSVHVTGVGGNNGNNSGNYVSTCLTSASASCLYAKANNAFHSDNSIVKNLEGECTWYGYGRVVELSENNQLASGVSSKFKTAFWGQTGRSARYWPSKLGGTWHSTSATALPQHLRKKGLLVVWVYGEHGHVAFVESVSADKKTYTISEYNNPIGSGHKTRTLPFDGNDKMGGVYPQFLDLNTY